jgi:exonuclease VII small subunit
MRSQKLMDARKRLDDAISELDEAHITWAECVTSLHMAEINVRKAQKALRECYNSVAEVLNGDG